MTAIQIAIVIFFVLSAGCAVVVWAAAHVGKRNDHR